MSGGWELLTSMTSPTVTYRIITTRHMKLDQGDHKKNNAKSNQLFSWILISWCHVVMYYYLTPSRFATHLVLEQSFQMNYIFGPDWQPRYECKKNIYIYPKPQTLIRNIRLFLAPKGMVSRCSPTTSGSLNSFKSLWSSTESSRHHSLQR